MLKIKPGFTLAEMMVVMLILSIVMAAMAPVMTTRNKLDQSSPWQWSTNGSDAYYGLGDAQVAMIGQQEAQNEDAGARLVINTGDGKDHILFKTDETVLGRLKFENNGLLLGNLASGNLVENSVAIGRNTRVSVEDSTAVGTNASAPNNNATALGYGAESNGYASIAIGGSSNGGHSAQATTDGSIAIGGNSYTGGLNSIAIGLGANANAENSIAIGLNTRNLAGGTNSIAIGQNNTVSTIDGIILGNSNTISSGGIAIGKSVHTGLYGVAIGVNSDASDGVAIGGSATENFGAVSGYHSIAIGPGAEAADYSTAIGYNATSSAAWATSLGYSSQTSERYATAVGYNSVASAYYATALGYNAEASGTHSIAIGSVNAASETNSIAIGWGTNASKANNVAIGGSACYAATGSGVTCIGANSGPVAGSSLTSASNIVYLGNSNDTVYIPGNLVVDNHVLLNRNSNSKIYFREGDGNKNIFMFAKADSSGKAMHGSSMYGTINVGVFDATGFVTAIDGINSDRRLKYVSKENTSGLDKIKQLKVFNYTFKKDEKKTPHVGVIAQDLQKVFPDAVKKGVDGFLNIRMEDMFFAMINAIKELDAKYQAQEARINELEARIEKLEARIK